MGYCFIQCWLQLPLLEKNNIIGMLSSSIFSPHLKKCWLQLFKNRKELELSTYFQFFCWKKMAWFKVEFCLIEPPSPHTFELNLILQRNQIGSRKIEDFHNIIRGMTAFFGFDKWKILLLTLSYFSWQQQPRDKISPQKVYELLYRYCVHVEGNWLYLCLHAS